MTWLADLILEITPDHPLGDLDALLAALLATDPDPRLLRHLAVSAELSPPAWERLVAFAEHAEASELTPVLLCRDDCSLERAERLLAALTPTQGMDLVRSRRAFRLRDEVLTALLVRFPAGAQQHLDVLLQHHPRVLDALLRSFLEKLADPDLLSGRPGPRSALIHCVRTGLADPERATWMLPDIPVRALSLLRPLPDHARAVLAEILRRELGTSQLRWHTVFSLSEEFGGSLAEILLVASQMDEPRPQLVQLPVPT